MTTTTTPPTLPELIARLAHLAPHRWGVESLKGLTPQGLGRMLMTG